MMAISRQQRRALARSKRPVSYSSDEQKSTIVSPLSNYEGWKRLELGYQLAQQKAAAKVPKCDECGKDARAWRLVASLKGMHTHCNLIGRFERLCDGRHDSCAQKRVRSGDPEQEIGRASCRERVSSPV